MKITRNSCHSFARVCLFAALFLAESLLADSPRERLLLDSGWRFQLGDPADVLSDPAKTNVTYYPEVRNLAKTEARDVTGSYSETNLAKLRPDPVATKLGETVSTVQINFDDTSWKALDLPHDWVVSLPFSSTGDLNHGCKELINGTNSANTVGWYRRTFTLPASYANKSLWLEFDGAYRNCLVWLNGHILGRNVSGYTSFSFDVSQYANPGGTNVLVVRVDASRFEGWFYEGAGIYRHMWLVKTDPVHVAHWGTYVTNSVSGTDAIVSIQTQVNNDGASPATCTLTSQIMDPSGAAVANVAQTVTVGAKTNNIVIQTANVSNAQLWSLKSPRLHKLVSTVTQGAVTNDIYQTPFGIRTLRWDVNLGFFLNGESVKLQGMCNHQDHAGVGIAVPDRVQFFRVERLKEMGCNTWRTSHNTPTPELMDACDQLGMLVLDETRRVGIDPESLGQLKSHILRDRNHPSVFAWSLGNEETDIQGTTTGATIMSTMQNLAHQLDPTRLCTVAQNGSWGKGFTTVIDIQGYNYRKWGDEDAVHVSFPNLPSFATEEGSTEAARGIYSDTSTYKRSYDNEPTHSYTIQELWQFYLARPWNAGMCIWTGFDYRGEPTPFGWPNISSQYAPLDTCGFAKDIYYYYQANWTRKPVLHILPHWNWSTPGQIVNVWVYSSCDYVELFLNGISQGRKIHDPLGHLEWNIAYAPGTLKAVGYMSGQAVLTNSVTTTGAATAIALEPDRKTILADGRDVSIVTVSVVDSQGRVVPTASNTVTFTISAGTIIGLGNGDPICHESDQATNNVGTRSVFSGLAQVIVKSTNQAGPMVLTATANGLSSASVVMNQVSSAPAPQTPDAPNLVVTSGQVWLSWDIVPGAIAYNVKRAASANGPFSTIANSTGDLAFTDTNIVNGTPYYYVLTALNANGESSLSPVAQATPHVVPPFYITQPSSFTNYHQVYAGVPARFSALVYGTQPLFYQWYEVINGITNAIAGATNATFVYSSENESFNAPEFFLTAMNGASNVLSSKVSLVNVPRTADMTKANTKTFNGTGDWISGAVLDGTRIGSFDSTLSGANAAALTLGADVTLAGLLFAENLNGPVLVGSGNTLSIDSSDFTGWSGIDMSAANKDVTLYCGLRLKGGQAWNVAPDRMLSIGGNLTTTGAGVDFSQFAGTLGALGNVNGILGPWATIGSGTSMAYARVNGGIVSPFNAGTAASANGMTNALTNYTFSGPLTLSARSQANTLQYEGNIQTLSLGTNTLTLNGLMNSGSGSLTVSGTTGTGLLTIGAGKELVIAGNDQKIVISCAITNNAAGDSSLTYNGIGGGTLVLNPNSGSTTTDDANTFTGDLVVNGGVLSVQKQVNVNPTKSTPLGDRTISGRSIVVNSGATLSFDIGNELGRGTGPNYPLMTIVANKGGTVRSMVSNRTLGPVLLNGGTLSILNVNGAQYEPFGLSADVNVIGKSPSFIASVAGGGVNLTAGAGANAQRTFNVSDVTGDSDVDLTVSAILANTAGNTATAAGLIKAGAGTMNLAVDNIYTGPTTINQGTLLIDGSIGNGNVTVNSGGILGGMGVINGAVTNKGILQPGHGFDTTFLTISNKLTLAGTTIFALNRSNAQNSCRILGVTTLTRGGALVVTNVGSPLQSGDAFMLFDAASYTGNFAATNLPALLNGLSWTNYFSGTSYVIKVVGQVIRPTIGNVRFGAGNLLIGGSGGVAGQQYRILASTNLALPIAEWLPVFTNNFSADGACQTALPLKLDASAQYFRIITP